MEQVLEVIYRNDALMPLKTVSLPENQRMKITHHLPAEKRAADTLTSWQQIYTGLSDTDVTFTRALNAMRQRLGFVLDNSPQRRRLGQSRPVLADQYNATSKRIVLAVTVPNSGPADTTAVVWPDTPPKGVTFLPATASQWSCRGSAAVKCSLGTLASGKKCHRDTHDQAHVHDRHQEHRNGHVEHV
jgi:uncharacterized repeat protein (TIGR01451 family)